MLVDPQIMYMFVLPDWEPEEVSPLQGYPPGLFPHIPLLQSLVGSPGDVYEYAIPKADRIARRISGGGGFHWAPFNVSSLPDLDLPAGSPFWVMLSAERSVAEKVNEWRRGQQIPILHIGRGALDGVVLLSDVTAAMLNGHCREALAVAHAIDPTLDITACQQCLDRWDMPQNDAIPLEFEPHNVTVPNEMVLLSLGFERGRAARPVGGDHIAAIEESVRHVRNLREDAGDPPAFRFSPPRPDTILLAPAMYQHIDRLPDAILQRASPGLREAVRALQRQSGYATEVKDEQIVAEADYQAVISLRRQELLLQTAAVGLHAASTVAATIRLPAGINRTAGTVSQLGKHLRRLDDAKPSKTARVFRAVQDAMTQYVGADLTNLIRESRSGIKLVGDAPLEWFPLDGLPLGIRCDVSRINATPGGLTFGELPQMPPLYLEPDDFRNFLVISSFGPGDGLREALRTALEVNQRVNNIELDGHFVEVESEAQLIEALNNYDGAIAILNMHGQHEGAAGHLIVGRDRVDVWSLRTNVRMPPIVILGACDTHPADRTHATVANGFITCGARAVLGTMLPVRAVSVALFVSRLLLRAIEFTQAMANMGQAVLWTQVVSGLLRMQLAFELISGLAHREKFSHLRARELVLEANTHLNPPDPAWFEWLGETSKGEANLTEADWQSYVDDVVAGSDVIRFMHLGNPESIVVTSPVVAERMREEIARRGA